MYDESETPVFNFIVVKGYAVNVSAGVVVFRTAEYGDVPQDQIVMFHDPALPSAPSLLVPASELGQRAWARRHDGQAPAELFRSDQFGRVVGLYIQISARDRRLVVTIDERNNLALTARVISRLVPAARERGAELLLSALKAAVALPKWDEEAERRGLPAGSHLELVIAGEQAAAFTAVLGLAARPGSQLVTIGERPITVSGVAGESGGGASRA